MSEPMTDDDLAAIKRLLRYGVIGTDHANVSGATNKDVAEAAVELLAEVLWLRAELDKPADVLNDHDAVTQEHVELWERSPGDALAKAVSELLRDFNDAINDGIKAGR